jgi:F-type H+-transporting ATPase subunit b
MFDSRRDYIGTTINEAEKAKKDAYARLLDAEQKRLKSYQEAQTILEDARTESFLHYDDIINKAQVDAEQILAKAKEESIDFKKNLELENEKRIANIVFNVSESLLKEKINHEKNKRFIAEFIEQTEEKENNV